MPTLKGSDIENYAIYLTSSELRGSGIVNDRYYYVDKQGNRTEIDNSCIFHGFVGGTDGGIEYQVLQVTNSDCGQEFQFSGHDRFFAQKNEVFKYWGSRLD